MPHALLLSPDDQAVNAITGVLEEMSVTCERPLDGVSAAQQLNSRSFDLVLVDCENLPAAKLIFDVCRRGHRGNNPIPIAIVDGRAGLPTAFRLGAELILTKPVAKDQARITIRTAISRVKREDAQAAAASPQESATHAVAAQASPVVDSPESFGAPQERAFAAAASAGSTSLTSVSDAPPALGDPNTAMTMTMSAAVAEPEPEIVEADSSRSDNLATGTNNESGATAHLSAARSSAMSADVKTATAKSAPIETEEKVEATAGTKDDEAKAEAKAEDVVSATQQIAAKSSATEKKSEEKSGQKSPKNQGQKSHGRVVTLVVLLVACGAFYAAWLYEPGFQALAKSQINHFLVVIGMAPQPQPTAPAPVRPAVPTAKPSAGVPAQTSTPDAALPSQPAGADPNTALSVTSSPAASSPAASSPVSSSPAASTTPTSPALSIKPTATAGVQATPSAAGQSAPAAAGTAQSVSGAANPAAKSGVTRIDLSPAAVAQPAPKTVKHAPPATPPQN